MLRHLLGKSPAPTLSMQDRTAFGEHFVNQMNNSYTFDAACKALATALDLPVQHRAELALAQYSKYPKTLEALEAAREPMLAALPIEQRDEVAAAFDSALAAISARRQLQNAA